MLQGDPGDCTVYYECSADRDEIIIQTCPSDTNFDRKQRACVAEDLAKCTRPCKGKVADPQPKPDMEKSTTPNAAEPDIPAAGVVPGDEDTTAEPPELLPDQPLLVLH